MSERSGVSAATDANVDDGREESPNGFLRGHNDLRHFWLSALRAAGYKELSPAVKSMIPTFSSEGFLNDLDSIEGVDPLGSQPPTPIPEANEDTPLLASKLSCKAQERVDYLGRQREESHARTREDEREPLLIRRIARNDGTSAEVIVGQSTMPQTIFNSANVLIGVGMMSLPLGIKYAGWVMGLGGLILSAFVTRYTAGILSKCLDVDASLANFGDIAYVAFGDWGRRATSALFTFELLAAEIALIILFADSLGSLIPGQSIALWKILCGCILVPLNFFPMRWLSYTSFMGIVCGLSLLIVIFADGMLVSRQPGSLRNPMEVHPWPKDWMLLPLSFGLLLAPWGGLSVFPNIYRDMRHPWRYEKGLKYTFVFVTFTDLFMAVVGILMYGDETLDEITTNVLRAGIYPQAMDILILVLIAIIPLTKFPLNCSPIISTFEVLFLIDPRAQQLKPNRFNQSKAWKKFLRTIFRVMSVVVIVIMAIYVPSFEVISAIMGAAFCSVICIILPCAFHLKMFDRELSPRQKAIDWSLIVTSGVLGLLGTIWEFIPREWLG